MRAWVFGEPQIEPALTAWFGSQRLDTDAELALRLVITSFLSSDEAKGLRFTNHDPKASDADPA
ncbi:MAG: hypothetical protein ACT4PZ_19450 [Panacagrimonas sp.]